MVLKLPLCSSTFVCFPKCSTIFCGVMAGVTGSLNSWAQINHRLSQRLWVRLVKTVVFCKLSSSVLPLLPLSTPAPDSLLVYQQSHVALGCFDSWWVCSFED